MAEDLKLSHSREFTNHEILTLRVWFDLDAAGLDDLAEKFLDAGLMLEHYTSLLDNDPSKRSPQETAQQNTMAFEVNRLLNQAEAALQEAARKKTQGHIQIIQGGKEVQ